MVPCGSHHGYWAANVSCCVTVGPAQQGCPRLYGNACRVSWELRQHQRRSVQMGSLVRSCTQEPFRGSLSHVNVQLPGVPGRILARLFFLRCRQNYSQESQRLQEERKCNNSKVTSKQEDKTEQISPVLLECACRAVLAGFAEDPLSTLSGDFPRHTRCRGPAPPHPTAWLRLRGQREPAG